MVLREVWRRAPFQQGMSTLRYSSFSYFSPLHIVDTWNYQHSREDLSTDSTVVLDFRQYLQKYFIWRKDLFKNYFDIYLCFILKVCQQSHECVWRRVFECKLDKLLEFVFKGQVYDCSIKKQDSCSESFCAFVTLLRVT